jgi:hypothetical protein
MVVKVNGTSGLIFPDNTTQSTAGTAFAANQTWQAFNTSSRASGVTYTNSSGKPIVVVIARYGGDGSTTTIYVGGVVAAAIGVDRYGGSETMTTVVPNGSTYSMTNNYGTHSGWWELR